MKLNLLDTKGNKTEINVNDEVFGFAPNTEFIKQYLYIYKTNQRQGTSSTKTRGEVQGSAAKPWKQKGTGRARVGEKRNPIWRHGGVAHGPKPKDWRIKLSKSVKDSAFLSALSIVNSKGALFAYEKLEFDKPKTSQATDFLKSANIKGKTLLVLGEKDTNVIKSFANVRNVKTVLFSTLNTYDLLDAQNVLFEKGVISSIEKKYLGEEEK